MLDRAFWIATAERVVRAFAVTLATVLSVDGVLDLRGVDWGEAFALSGGAALLNFLLSLVAATGIGPKGSPSLVADPNAATPTRDPIVDLADRDARREDPLA